jgi:hypothetical protein
MHNGGRGFSLKLTAPIRQMSGILRRSILSTFHWILGLSNQGDDMGGLCSMHHEAEKCLNNFSWKA